MIGYIAVLVESPSKCGKIEKFLGAGYRCKATFGHFRTLSALEDIDEERGFQPSFKDVRGKASIISELRVFIANAKSVIIATDDDREGEAIAWHVCDKFRLDVLLTPRMIFHEVTEGALVRALSNLTRVNMELVQAQKARQVLDLLVGFTISPLLWKHIDVSTKAPLSAGRCQTPALRLVYDNQLSIENAPGEAAFSVTGHFTSKNIEFALSTSLGESADVEEFLEASKTFDHQLVVPESFVVSREPPLPFNTSTLQQKASSELRMSPKKTMEQCQILYEQGHITYMRTDAQEYADEFVVAANNYITTAYGAEYVRPKPELLAQPEDENAAPKAAHEAIRPTCITGSGDPPGLEAHTIRLYKLIYRNTVQSCMSNSVHSVCKAHVTAPAISARSGLEYRKTFEQMTFDGWETLASAPSNPTFYGYIAAMGSQPVAYNTITAKYTIKKLKNHLTEAKLVQLLESKGIGRPSTFSSLVEKVQTRGYVKKENVPGREHSCPVYELERGGIRKSTTKKKFGEEKSKLVLQPLGRAVIEFLVTYFDGIFQYDYTRTLERNLDGIAAGERVLKDVCGECKTLIDGVIASNGFEKRVRIPIDATHTYVIGKHGPVVLEQQGGKTRFHRVKDGVKQGDIASGVLTLADIVSKDSNERASLGMHQGAQVSLCRGRFGAYIRWNDRNYSCGNGAAPTLAEAILLLKPNVELSKHSSIRHSKHGPYIYFKKPDMSKPNFTSIPSSVDASDVAAVRSWIASRSKS